MRVSILVLIAPLALLFTDCGPPTAGPCPACPQGSFCDTNGSCVPIGGGDDMAVGAGDLLQVGQDAAAVCKPACAGGLHCNALLQCVACLTDQHCPVGQICKTLGNVVACVPGCANDDRCRGGDGGANMACCGGSCVDTGSDTSNCGGCGSACSGAHASSSCAGGVCQLGACSAGWADCNKDPRDGCEVNTHIDKLNCTACGTICSAAHGTSACSDGCYLAACDFGYDDCDGDPKNGCETSVLADLKHCGSCGTPCKAKANAVVGCVNAACVIASCNLGFLDCDGDPTNGCETVSGTDPNNCGACGNVCPMNLICKGSQCTCANCNFANASSRCVNQMCLFDKCNPGFADCDNNQVNGCEVSILTDGKNCNGCGMACPNNAPNCINGACMSGFTHHDGLGDTWVDNTPVATYTITQAAMACNVYVTQKLGGKDTCNLQGCGCGGQNSCVYNLNQNPRYTWFYNNDTMGGQVTLNCCGCASMHWD